MKKEDLLSQELQLSPYTPRLDDLDGIKKRCETLVHTEKELSEEEKQEIIADIVRLIDATHNEELFKTITGSNPDDFFRAVERSNNGSANLVASLDAFNGKTAQAYGEKRISRKELMKVQSFKIAAFEPVADHMRLHEREESEDFWKEQTEKKRAEIDIGRQVDAIIDKYRGRDLQIVLQAIARLLWDTIGENEITRLTISYVNENNDYLEFDELTRVIPSGDHDSGQPPITQNVNKSAFPAKIFSSPRNTSIYDPASKTHYLSMKLGKQCLGIIEIVFRDRSSRITADREQLCRNAISMIDTYLDNGMKKRRLNRNQSKVDDILNEAGTDIVFKEGVEEGFRRGLVEALTYLCTKTGAQFINLKLDVAGDGKSYPMDMFVGAQGEQSPETLNNAGKSHEAISKDLNIPQRHAHGKINAAPAGSITFFGEDLDDEDRDMLDKTAQSIAGTVRSWRTDLFNTINYGLPPKVALLRKLGRLCPSSVEQLSMSYTDIRGFTKISARLHDITRKYGLKEDYISRLIGFFDYLGKDIAEKSGGCYDKTVGDCLVINAGPPYTTDGRDVLGLTEHEPMFHAMNCLKIALRIRKAMQEFRKYFKKLLLEMATEIGDKHKSGPKSRSIYPGNRQEILLHHFCRTHRINPLLQVTQGISSGTASVGLMQCTEPGMDSYSKSYTVYGDAMNVAARLQSLAQPDEMLVNKRTMELVTEAINQNLPIPFNENGDCQTWEEFKLEYLGDEYKDFDLVPSFEEAMLELKGKPEFELAYRVRFEKTGRKPVQIQKTVSEDELRCMDGHYNVISNNPKARLVELRLQGTHRDASPFTATIREPKIEIRYVTPEDYDNRVASDSDSVLKVQNGNFILYNYKSVEETMDAKFKALDHDQVHETDHIPHGIYIIRRKLYPRDLGHDQIILELEMFGTVRAVRINKDELLALADLEERAEAKTIHDIHRYLFDKNTNKMEEEVRGYVSKDEPAETEILFVHSSGEFIGKLTPGT